MPDDSFLPFVRLRMHLQIGQLDAASQALDEAMNYFDAVENPARRSAILGYRAMIAFYRARTVMPNVHAPTCLKR